MKRIFEVRADQGWLSSRAPESFIWWFNGGAWQNVKGLVRVGRISSSFGYSNENFTNSFFPFFEIYWKRPIVLAKPIRADFTQISCSTKLKCERSNALIETGCRGKMVNVYSIHFCQCYRYRDGENTIESKWMCTIDESIVQLAKKIDLTGWIKRCVLFSRVGNEPIGNTDSLTTPRPSDLDFTQAGNRCPFVPVMRQMLI